MPVIEGNRARTRQDPPAPPVAAPESGADD
jgi:hypothetical protein